MQIHLLIPPGRTVRASTCKTISQSRLDLAIKIFCPVWLAARAKNNKEHPYTAIKIIIIAAVKKWTCFKWWATKTMKNSLALDFPTNRLYHLTKSTTLRLRLSLECQISAQKTMLLVVDSRQLRCLRPFSNLLRIMLRSKNNRRSQLKKSHLHQWK